MNMTNKLLKLLIKCAIEYMDIHIMLCSVPDTLRNNLKRRVETLRNELSELKED